MKNFVFRMCSIVLLITGITTYIYSDALSYRNYTFTPVKEDAFIESMDYTHFISHTVQNVSEYSLVAGILYPENDRHSHKNSFLKLYDESGKLIISEVLDEENCDILITDIVTSDDGFIVVCEIRGNDKYSGKSFVYDQSGKFLYSTYITYNDSVVQTAGTKYLVSHSNDYNNYIAIDEKKVVVADDKGNYVNHIDYDENTTVNDAIIYDNILYIVGSRLYNETVPYSAIYAYEISNRTLLWKQEKIMLSSTKDASYSQIDDIRIITDSTGLNSIILSIKHFDTESYTKYAEGLADKQEYNIDTIAKKSLGEDFPLYQTSTFKSDYRVNPLPSLIFAKLDKNGKQIITKKYDVTQDQTISAVSISGSTIDKAENINILISRAQNVKKDDTLLKYSLMLIDHNLNEKDFGPLKTDSKAKTYIALSQQCGIYTYNSINSTDQYKTLYFENTDNFVKHTKKIGNANKHIQNFNDIYSKLPIIIMYLIMYTTIRIKTIKEGNLLFSFICTYLHKLKTCISGKRTDQQTQQ